MKKENDRNGDGLSKLKNEASHFQKYLYSVKYVFLETVARKH